ncbi:GNAT family N-acetyltransferase [Muricauda ruestringensis]|uniref:GNAT family N-acetyltransferase n=1 Tax=Flagellimonas ruestringensis TaxID=111501 RepID=UPI001CD67805|nr:GNAT family N-acetyltransferase [Allomuricauda ruestringensis]MCA0957886.1 GNAT family N-acetyltransferase [Allomuricauda ruestringensis]
MDKVKIEFKMEPLNGELPYRLLLLADESKAVIDTYINHCEVFILEQNHKTIAVVAIEQLNKSVIEIKNIAVDKAYQNKGIGKNIINWVKRYYQKTGKQEILVGTGDASVLQLLFYLKCGFEMDSIRKSFFLKNYDMPIYENGIRLKDMIVLKLVL